MGLLLISLLLIEIDIPVNQNRRNSRDRVPGCTGPLRRQLENGTAEAGLCMIVTLAETRGVGPADLLK
jgi:hypothetical protein